MKWRLLPSLSFDVIFSQLIDTPYLVTDLGCLPVSNMDTSLLSAMASPAEPFGIRVLCYAYAVPHLSLLVLTLGFGLLLLASSVFGTPSFFFFFVPGPTGQQEAAADPPLATRGSRFCSLILARPGPTLL